GRSVLPDNMTEIDLIVCGTVAVNLDGARIGKGGGYSDLEFGLAREVGLVRQKTPVVTTVHDLQVLDDKLPVLVHDIPVDVIVTPTRVIQTHTQLPRPKGIYWDYLPKEKIDEIPYLKPCAYPKSSDHHGVCRHAMFGNDLLNDVRNLSKTNRPLQHDLPFLVFYKRLDQF